MFYFHIWTSGQKLADKMYALYFYIESILGLGLLRLSTSCPASRPMHCRSSPAAPSPQFSRSPIPQRVAGTHPEPWGEASDDSPVHQADAQSNQKQMNLPIWGKNHAPSRWLGFWTTSNLPPRAWLKSGATPQSLAEIWGVWIRSAAGPLQYTLSWTFNRSPRRVHGTSQPLLQRRALS